MSSQQTSPRKRNLRQAQYQISSANNTTINNQNNILQQQQDNSIQMVPIPIKPQYQLLFCKTNNIIAKMLINLQEIFLFYGINLNIQYYHSSILKIIMPTELLCFVEFCHVDHHFRERAMNMLYPFKSDVRNDYRNDLKNDLKNDFRNDFRNDLKNDDNLRKVLVNGRRPYKKRQQHDKQSQKNYDKNDKIDKKNSINSQKSIQDINKIINDDVIDLGKQQQNQQQQQQQEEYPSQFRYNRRKVRRKPVLDKQLQRKLCNWLTTQVQSGKPITIDHFAQKARILVNRKTFVGSAGWCRRFFSHHPTLRQYLTRRHIYQPKKTSFNFAKQFQQVCKNSIIAKTADVNHDLPNYQIKQQKIQSSQNLIQENSSSLSENQYLDQFIKKQQNKKKQKQKQKQKDKEKNKDKQKNTIPNHYRDIYQKLKNKKKFYQQEIQNNFI